jgi:hypothetical protein
MKKQSKKLKTSKISNFLRLLWAAQIRIRCIRTNHKRQQRLCAKEQKREMSRQIHRITKTSEPVMLQEQLNG